MRTEIWGQRGIPRKMTAPESIARVIREHKCKRIAEIGVHVCSFCDQLMNLLKNYPYLEEYYLIDPWPYGYKCGSLGGPNVPPERWESWHFGAVKRTIGNMILRVIRMTSVEASKLFSDGYLDLAYIDADHTYKSLTEDITVWLPKCSKVICGHDYSGGWQEVVRAVDDFFNSRAGKEGSEEHFFKIDGGDKHYRMDSGVWVVEIGQGEGQKT